jgi:hypothetical protein
LIENYGVNMGNNPIINHPKLRIWGSISHGGPQLTVPSYLLVEFNGETTGKRASPIFRNTLYVTSKRNNYE